MSGGAAFSFWRAKELKIDAGLFCWFLTGAIEDPTGFGNLSGLFVETLNYLAVALREN